MFLYRARCIRTFCLTNKIFLSTINKHIRIITSQPNRGKKSDCTQNISLLFQPVLVKPTPDDINVGAELTTTLRKTDLLKLLNSFIQVKEVIKLSTEYGLDNYLRKEAFNSFRRYCVEIESLPVDLHVVISDILQGAGNITDIFPYFMKHAKDIFPHLECLDDLKKISDLRTPANWYPVARTITRKIIFHAGPTNSGKTYHALERFMVAKSGVYCGPLKLLAAEVFNKCNSYGTPCDLITGEERKYATSDKNFSKHISCTVEMMALNVPCEVAVIDEIQSIKDFQRGWAWTRALLGVPANEVHLCGEAAAIDLVKSLCLTTGESVEVRKYNRLTELEVQNTALRSLNHIQRGDCIVCFSKNDIYTVSRNLEEKNIEVAVIYGSLPPGTKLAQAAKFNDIHHPCKVLVATDAIGMGLNLHIRRIIFYSLIKPAVNDRGEREMNTISVSSALQIAGRAGRYGTQWGKGYVTTFKPEDLLTLKNLLSKTPDIISQAGLHPTADQIELYAYHLPKTPLSNLMDIFVSLCTVDDSMYFICNVDDLKFLADMIEHVPLPIRDRYIFCCAPINRKIPLICTTFLRFARQYSKNEAITFDWICLHINWPLSPPKTLIDLIQREAVFDVLDLYLWLSVVLKSK
ncbi:ATP-dependent RNA helicase SUV3 homolog, mitochondrial [Copidosoma floridanum]|uniref:ATP-dependent RNA helicase SUV3 homolog, mitochondrial n=1 Tax=Copidosoma floridanum TaxID=29053 RepID=UPI000C6F89CF|nr:ATP-dependent RNA helicase SUV3 homolog, mitochondrial [Copidosoma floridanum]